MDISIAYLKTSKLLTRAALPSNNVYLTHAILVFIEVKGAENDASASQNDIPISAYFKAVQSFAPSPVIQTFLF